MAGVKVNRLRKSVSGILPYVYGKEGYESSGDALRWVKPPQGLTENPGVMSISGRLGGMGFWDDEDF